MRPCWLPALLFASLGLAETVGYWTLHKFQLSNLSHDECVYQFWISQDEGDTPGDHCWFWINGVDGQAANQTSFSNVDCQDNSQYRVNGGWDHDGDGFITVVVYDKRSDVNAYFSYASHQIDGGQTVNEQTRLAYKAGTFDITNVVIPVKRQDDSDLPKWQILDLTWEYANVSSVVEMHFTIQVSPTMESPCTVITRGADADEVDVGSFHKAKCVESEWVVSWDYFKVLDVAVLTLFDPTMMMESVFPWENASSYDLGDSGSTVAFKLPLNEETHR